MNTNTIESVKEKKHHEFLSENTDFEVRSMDTMCVNESELGTLSGKSEIYGCRNFVWNYIYKIRSYFMVSYTGNVSSSKLSYVWCDRLSIVVGIISVFLIKKFKIKSIDGEADSF